MASIKRIDHVQSPCATQTRATQQYVNLLNAVHIRTEILREKAGTVKVSYMQIGENVLSLVESAGTGRLHQPAYCPSTAKACITWVWKWTT